MLKQRLSQKLLQKLSPQQIQLMKLLQVPTASLEQRIKEELEANPALEEGMNAEENVQDEPQESLAEEVAADEGEEPATDEVNAEEDINWEDYYDDPDDIPNYKLKGQSYYDPDEDKTIPTPVISTFHEYLLEQLGMCELDEREEQIAQQIVGNIGDDGYMRRDLENIVDDLAFTQNITTTEEELGGLLAKIQEFDPPGVGARSLQECLLLQLSRQEHQDKVTELAKIILENHFDAFTKKHYEKLRNHLEVSDADLKAAVDEIVKLNPKPGSGYAPPTKSTQYVVPDFFITNKDGELELTLNGRNAPELKISNSYKDMFEAYAKNKKRTKADKEAVMFIKQKIDAAKWFIDAIRQRQHTLLSTMQTIMDYQREYFLTGDETKLKPMILKDIAQITGLDISTISRVANSKYVQTEFGTFALKYFFSESLSTESGEEVSTREVKKILSDFIENEDKRRPFSDQKLTDMLKEKGYNIARRTVAKYREQLNIPVARLRKQL